MPKNVSPKRYREARKKVLSAIRAFGKVGIFDGPKNKLRENLVAYEHLGKVAILLGAKKETLK